ncbi:DUF4870 family protein [Kordiimonas sp.]|uniref:DUF4870 family protein n=1 Tax=Kordiimonas sp. TaxID=1970157 RepID=UPI003A9150EC
MSDYDNQPRHNMGRNIENDKDRTAAIVVYILYFMGFAAGITAFVGVVIAHSKATHDPVWRSHFDFQIRTFWLGLATLIVGGVLSLVLIGYVILAWWTLWTVIRIIKGGVRAINNQPIDDPQTLLW